MDFEIINLPKDKYKYHELHYVYNSDEDYLPIATSCKEEFSFTFTRRSLEKTYHHDSYDTLFEDYWQDCQAFGVCDKSSGDIVAYLEISREEWNDRLRITNLLVIEEYRRRKIGTLLIEKVKEIARQEDRRIIILETQSCNIPAIDFYMSHGFTFAGTNIYFYSNIDIEYDEVMIEMAYRF